jgi:hypothetical protein
MATSHVIGPPDSDQMFRHGAKPSCSVLPHVLGLAPVPQETETDAKKLRRCIAIHKLQRGAVAAGDAQKCRGKLLASSVLLHRGGRSG